jgi:hypothetical membrane protein
VKALTWCGVFAPVLRLGLILLLGFLDPEYSHLRNYISELGARDAPAAVLMNGIGTVLVGALLCGFSLALYRGIEPGFLATAGAALLASSGLAFIVVGLFPCDPGCSMVAPSATMRVHVVAGTVAMSAQTLAPMALGLRIVSGTGNRRYAAISLVCGAVAIMALIVLLLGQGEWLAFPGLVQKTYQIAADAWVLLSAIHLLGNWRPGRTRNRLATCLG